MKAFVAFDSKYGNTKRAAQLIADGIRETGGVDVEVCYVKDVEIQKLSEYEVLIFGAPNHMGKPSRTMTSFVDSLQKFQLNAKWTAVFDTYFAKPRNCGKAMKKLEQRLGERLPNLKPIVPGISVKVEGVNGPITEGELPRCREFGRSIAERLKAASS